MVNKTKNQSNRPTEILGQKSIHTTENVTKGVCNMKKSFDIYLTKSSYATLSEKCKKMNISREEFFLQAVYKDNILCVPANNIHLLLSALQEHGLLHSYLLDELDIKGCLNKLSSAFLGVFEKTAYPSEAKKVTKGDVIVNCIQITLSEEASHKLYEKCEMAQITPLSFFHRCINEDYIVVDPYTDDLCMGMALYSDAIFNPTPESLKALVLEMNQTRIYLDTILAKIDKIVLQNNKNEVTHNE